jgi:hypothetical protein
VWNINFLKVKIDFQNNLQNLHINDKINFCLYQKLKVSTSLSNKRAPSPFFI